MLLAEWKRGGRVDTVLQQPGQQLLPSYSYLHV